MTCSVDSIFCAAKDSHRPVNSRSADCRAGPGWLPVPAARGTTSQSASTQVLPSLRVGSGGGGLADSTGSAAPNCGPSGRPRSANASSRSRAVSKVSGDESFDVLLLGPSRGLAEDVRDGRLVEYSHLDDPVALSGKAVRFRLSLAISSAALASSSPWIMAMLCSWICCPTAATAPWARAEPETNRRGLPAFARRGLVGWAPAATRPARLLSAVARKQRARPT